MLTAQLYKVVDIARLAAQQILQVYAGQIKVEIKSDGSPVTQADRVADKIIQTYLQKLTPNLPILSEESDIDDKFYQWTNRRHWKKYWLIDPLDGTKEFINRSDDFTVNIALINHGKPQLGVVHCPVTDISYFATRDGAFKKVGNHNPIKINCRSINQHKIVLATSRSHESKRIAIYQTRLQSKFNTVEILRAGSSRKICLVAEGAADIYPRLGPTSEWDTAAAQCIIESAGGYITALDGARLTYTKPNLLNPWFIAYGDCKFNWGKLTRDIC